MIGEPLYDNDPVNLGYLNTRLGGTTTLLLSKAQNFGTLPSTPYYKYNTYMGIDGIYICVNERLIGEYNPADWTKASTYVNVEDAFNEGIITAGTLQAVNGGANTAGLTGQGTGDDSVRFWAGSTYANRANAPFRVTQGGAGTATNINITGGSLTWNNLNKPTKNDLGGWTTYINDSGIYTGTLTAGQVNAVAINADSITTGTISTSRLNSDVITTSNFSAQNISADRINSGTLTGRAISGGSINIANGSTYYLRMGSSWTRHPEVSGLNVNSAVLINGTELSISSGRLRAWGDFQAANFYCLGNVQANNYIASSSINLLAGNSSGSATGGGILLRTGGSGRHITLDAYNGGGNVYARGAGTPSSSNSLVLTNDGSSSSKNIKKNIKVFTKNKYDKALLLLNNINIYDYKLKYNNDKKDYGFIIDEVEELDNNDMFFDFHIEKAKVVKNSLDFAVDDDDETIDVKKYDSFVLDKYLLTVCKALLQEIEELKEEIQDLKGGK